MIEIYILLTIFSNLIFFLFEVDRERVRECERERKYKK